MKRTSIIVGIAALVLLSFQPPAQAASAKSVSGNQYFCVGVIVGLVNDYVPLVRPIMDKFTFYEGGLFTTEGINDSVGAYSIDSAALGLEKVDVTSGVVDFEKGLLLSFDINVINIIDLGIVGTIKIDGTKNFEDAGNAIGFFFGVRNIFD